MLGGNITGVRRTISITIYDQVQTLDYAGANSHGDTADGVLIRHTADHLRAQPPYDSVKPPTPRRFHSLDAVDQFDVVASSEQSYAPV